LTHRLMTEVRDDLTDDVKTVVAVYRCECGGFIQCYDITQVAQYVPSEQLAQRVADAAEASGVAADYARHVEG